ncbi:hypothetical protein D1872_287740 [compost metagenome]
MLEPQDNLFVVPNLRQHFFLRFADPYKFGAGNAQSLFQILRPPSPAPRFFRLCEDRPVRIDLPPHQNVALNASLAQLLFHHIAIYEMKHLSSSFVQLMIYGDQVGHGEGAP